MSKDEKIAKLEAENEDLKGQLAYLQRMMFGKKSERMKNLEDNPDQLALFEEKLKEKNAVSVSKTVEIPAHQRTAKQPKRLPLPEHLERREEVIEPEGDLSSAIKVSEEVTEVLEHQPAEFYVRRIIRPRYMLKQQDSKEVKFLIADLPADLPFPKSQLSASVATHVVTSKYVDHLPLHRILAQYKRNKMEIPQSTMVGWVKAIATTLTPIYEKMMEMAFQSDYLQVDESTIKVRKGIKGKTHQGYMWCYHDVGKKVVCFEYADSRSSKVFQKHLNHFRGYVQTDGYAGYDFLDHDADSTPLGCWAHARRYFFEAQDNDKERATYAIDQIRLLYALEEELQNLDDVKLVAEKRKELATPVMEHLHQWAEQEQGKVLPKSKIGKAIAYLLRRWKRLQVYLQDGRLKIDNNLIENKIRPLAIGRKNYLFAGNTNGAQWAAMFYSFFATASLHGINPEEWLKETLIKINNTNISEIEKLIPGVCD